jgi:GTP diphosphokinase / guanosine-3',5'-bis(diphosphate) 3'-diphosphatase
MDINNLVEVLPESYNQADRELILRAYHLADKAHFNQKRVSGEPYVNHCISVAIILAEMRVPPDVVAAGLLHDTVEDTDITLDDLKRDFTDEIALMVDGVTKLTQLPRVSRADQSLKEEERQEIARQ